MESTSGACRLGTQHTPQPEEQEEQQEKQQEKQESGGAQERGPPGQECSGQGIPTSGHLDGCATIPPASLVAADSVVDVETRRPL